LRKPKAAPRTGWADASMKLAAAGDDALVLPEFANEADAEPTW
jgi:antitoxin MazE